MSRSSIDIEYLEEVNFNIERISEFATVNSSMPVLHQSKNTIILFYFFSFLIIYTLVPQINEETLTIDIDYMFMPLLATSSLHFILTIGYIVVFILAGSGLKIILGLIHEIHFPICISCFVSVILYYQHYDALLFFPACLSAGIFADGLFGLCARPKRILVHFELICLGPYTTLLALERKGFITHHYYSLIPVFVYLFLYFLILILLSTPLKSLSVSILSDPEISAEFEASFDFQSYWNSAAWWDTAIRQSESDDSTSDSDNSELYSSLLSEATSTEVRFPGKADFQLYKLEEAIPNPYCISSLPVMLMILLTTAIDVLNCFTPLPEFFYIMSISILLVIVAILINSRILSISFMIITNLPRHIIEIMWDHPSFSVM